MLTDQDRDLIKGLIDRGEPLPARYRHSLFDDAPAAELIWPGKTSRVETVVLPFQSVEHIDEPRKEMGELDLFGMDVRSGRQKGGWTNKLIWGDNRLILSSLTNGPMREEVERAGGLKLIYVDPPFDIGADFSMDIEVGDEKVTKQPSVMEEIAYRDTWGKGTDSYIAMMYERLRLMHSLLAEDGLIMVHVDWRVDAMVRLAMDEIFGSDHFINEIIWSYRSGGASRKSSLPRKHDNILFYSKAAEPTIRGQSERQYLEKSFMGSKQDEEGRYYVDTILRDVIEGAPTVVRPDGSLREYNTRPVLNLSSERLGFPTQKPEGLLELLLEIGSGPGDLVADFFCGSGTTMAVAERLGRKWIGADLGRFAVHTSRKRLIDIQRDLKSAGKSHRAFEILNLGKYERQYFTGVDMALPEEERQAQSRSREEAFLSLILQAYAAERSTGLPPFHGAKGKTAVVIGPLEAPVTEALVQEAVDAASAAGISRVDVLGFEFEMGLKPRLQDEARTRGVNLALRYIPHEVFDKRAVDNGDVTFYDVAYVEVEPSARALEVTMTLNDFGVFYRQEDADTEAAGLRRGSSKVLVDGGQVVKISKDKKDVVTKEVMTKHWSDWIDYWAIDFDYESQPEILRVLENGEEKQVRTGRFIFENEWQSYRTRQNRKLELISAPHEYEAPGTYMVAIKVIDIFGNDTTKVLPIKAGG